MAKIPETMRSLVAPTKCKPSEYIVTDMPTPKVTDPKHILVKVHSAGINTGELMMAQGQLGIFNKPTYPMPIGLEGSGIVAAIGSEVKNFRVGDEVYGYSIEKPMFREPPPCFASEYALTKERFLLHKPPSISFEHAATVSGFVVMAYQVIQRGLQLAGWDSLENKTVYVPAALSGTGAVLIQVAKNYFGAKKIISTVSTSKIPLVEEYLPGMVDQVIDYTTTRPQDVVPKGSVDFMINTQWGSFNSGIPLLNPQTGILMSVTSLPSRATVEEMLAERFPFWLGPVLDLGQWYYKWLLWGTNIKYEMLSGGPHIREDLEKAGEIIARGQVRAVMRVVELQDIEAVRKGCDEVFTSKGGIGRFVVRVQKD